MAWARRPAEKNTFVSGCLACAMGQGACSRGFRGLPALRQGVQGPAWPAVGGTEGGKIFRQTEQENFHRGARKLLSKKHKVFE